MTPTCAWCDEQLIPVLDLGTQPLANALLSEDQLGDAEFRAPLELAICSGCGLVQITESVPPDVLFREYAYFSSYSDAFVSHARRITERVRASRAFGPDSLALEIASNDGYLLQHYARAGIPVLGIDPARNVAEVASAAGIPTLPEFFDVGLAEDLARRGQLADVVHANNVIAHVPGLDAFVAGIARVLKPDGIAVIETPYVRNLVDRLEFDTIYHEHRYYHALTTLGRILGRHGLAVTGVEHIPVHGGSLRIFAAHRGTAVRIVDVPAASTEALLAEEERLGLVRPAYYMDFAARVRALLDELRGRLYELMASGCTVAAYGAAAKGTVLLNALGIGEEVLSFVADRSPHKQGRFMPGVHVPIVPAERLVQERPDFCLLLAWNFADEILAQQSSYRAAGGKFLIPIPELTVV